MKFCIWPRKLVMYLRPHERNIGKDYAMLRIYIYLVMQCNAIFNTLRFLFSQYSTYKNGLFYYQYKRADALCRHQSSQSMEYAFL